MVKTLWALGFISVFLTSNPAFAAKKLALVWAGRGVCTKVCVSAAKDVAKKAGFNVREVKGNTRIKGLFEDADVWIQPGGVAATAAEDMGPELMQAIRDFVSKGGGYVGFCSGAFLATAKIGTTDVDGLGIMPGFTTVLRPAGGSHDMLRITTEEFGKRWIYFAGGPYLTISPEELKAAQGSITATYSDGSAASYQGFYGQGKVSVTGLHPEAGFWWKLLARQRDKDGGDAKVAIAMIKYATSDATPTIIEEEVEPEMTEEVVPEIVSEAEETVTDGR